MTSIVPHKWQPLGGLIFIALFGLCALSCFNPFAPALDKTPDLSNIITEQRNPDEVLQNFRYAYSFKDSLLYRDVLAESFVFEYFDPNLAPSGGFRTWGRDVDLKATGQLFRNFDVIELEWLNLLISERDTVCSEETDTVCPEAKIVLIVEQQFRRFRLNLLGSNFNFTITGTAIFTFQQNGPGNKWRIVRWKDESDL